MATHYNGSEEEIRALDTFIKLFRASDSVSNRINAHLVTYDLTVSQFGVMESIYHLGTLHQAQIADKILKTTGNVTHVIDHLEARGLVERQRKNSDRRYIAVTLTAAGRALMERIMPSHIARVVEVFGCLTPDEQDELARLCKKVGLGEA
jgi:MarR family transcriptional regulator, 2-MHQ and catechol-resistance regulon repressor